MLIYCLDENKNLRTFEVYEGNPELVKIALENKGYKIIRIDE